MVAMVVVVEAGEAMMPARGADDACYPSLGRVEPRTAQPSVPLSFGYSIYRTVCAGHPWTLVDHHDRINTILAQASVETPSIADCEDMEPGSEQIIAQVRTICRAAVLNGTQK